MSTGISGTASNKVSAKKKITEFATMKAHGFESWDEIGVGRL